MDNVQGQVVLVKDINDINNTGINGGFGNSSSPDDLAVSDGQLYFSAFEPETGIELWSSDGTTEGTQLVADVISGSRDYLPNYVDNPVNSGYRGYAFNPEGLTEFDGKVYFSAFESETGRELWSSDGTTEGTQLVANIDPIASNQNGVGESSFPNDFAELNGKLYFRASRQQIGSELWVSDGTTEGTQLVADINPFVRDSYYAYDGIYGSSSFPSDFAELDGKLYFSAEDGENGRELWVSDGTTEGTQLVVDIVSGGGSSSPTNFAEFDGKLYFTADDGVNGRELWATDGTAEGTQLVADIVSGGGSSSPTNFAEFDGKLYFTADGGDNNFELWVTDGTAEGTQLLVDINPNGSSDPGNFTELNGKLYFNADDGVNGRELWATDGTAEGTQLVADINPNGSSNPGGADTRPNGFLDSGGFAVFNDELYFSADNGETGEELYKLTFDDVVEPGEPNLIEGTQGDDTIEGTEGNDRIKGFSGNDVIFALGGNDTVFGDIFSDELDGGDGDDDLLGGLGNDTLNGGNGNDLLVGREGNDFFVLTPNEGEDTITDFDLESDRLVLGGGLTFEDLSFSNDSILVGEETLATLDGIDTTTLTANNFV